MNPLNVKPTKQRQATVNQWGFIIQKSVCCICWFNIIPNVISVSFSPFKLSFFELFIPDYSF